MLCPNCGTRTTTTHKFCRNCGLNLEPVSKAVAAHRAPGGGSPSRSAREADRRNVQNLTKGLFVGVVVVLLGVLVVAALPGRAFKLMGVMTALIGIVFSLVAVLSSLRAVAGGSDVAAPAGPDPLEGAPQTGPLLAEQHFEPVPSVTERTTDLLGVEVKGRKPPA